MAARSARDDTLAVMPSSTLGIGGNSEASVPMMRAWLRAQLSVMACGWVVVTMSTRSFCREPTNSERRREGTVISPSSSTVEPIQVLMATSRLVAVRRRRPWSVAISTFWVMGSVVRVATALPTMPRPLFNVSWRQDTFMCISPRGLHQYRAARKHAATRLASPCPPFSALTPNKEKALASSPSEAQGPIPRPRGLCVMSICPGA